jgi:hypothetical protein
MTFGFKAGWPKHSRLLSVSKQVENVVPTHDSSERRRSTRTAVKKRASLIVEHGRQAQRMPCLILDSSEHGFKIGGAPRLKRGERVELILGEHASGTLPCRVMWVGRESRPGGEAGLRTDTTSAR